MSESSHLSDTAPEAVQRLSDLNPGDSATIVAISDTAPEAVRRRLSDLGFASGTSVTMTRRAPMGDPSMFRLRDYNICLRKSEAQQLHVTASS